jgi:hypothetical protein
MGAISKGTAARTTFAPGRRLFIHSVPGLALLALATLAVPASAQWTQVPDIVASDVFSVWANGDTILVGADSVAYISTNAGNTWKRSATVAAGVTSVRDVKIRNGRLYAGTMRFNTPGQGVFISDNLGDTWTAFNQGLVGGIGNSQNDIVDLLIRGDSLYAATEGAGAWVRNLKAGSWIRYGDIFGPEQSTNMTAIAAGGSRLLACGGFNGTVFFRDPGQPDWTLSLLFNDHFAAGLAALSAAWNGHAWVVGSNIGVFQSATGQEPWTFVDFGLRPLFFAPVTTRGTDFFVSLGAGNGTLVAMSLDDGVTWQNVDTLAGALTYDMTRQGSTLYAGRVGGLWRRPIGNIVSVPDPGAASHVSFAIAGANPVGDRARFAFELPAAGLIEIEVFDVAGRRVGDAIREVRPAGHGEVGWNASHLAAGVYLARLSVAGERAKTRLVRTAAVQR